MQLKGWKDQELPARAESDGMMGERADSRWNAATARSPHAGTFNQQAQLILALLQTPLRGWVDKASSIQKAKTTLGKRQVTNVQQAEG